MIYIRTFSFSTNFANILVLRAILQNFEHKFLCIFLIQTYDQRIHFTSLVPPIQGKGW